MCNILRIEENKCTSRRLVQSKAEGPEGEVCFPWFKSYILVQLSGRLERIACKKEDMEYILRLGQDIDLQKT